VKKRNNGEVTRDKIPRKKVDPRGGLNKVARSGGRVRVIMNFVEEGILNETKEKGVRMEREIFYENPTMGQ